MRMMTRTLILSLFLCVFAAVAQASITLPLHDENDPYLIGKHAYHRKLACEGCPLADVVINADKAREIILRLENDREFTDILSEDEREAVSIYLKTLFRLN